MCQLSTLKRSGEGQIRILHSSLQAIRNVILVGLLENRRNLVSGVSPYFDFRDELVVCDGVVLHGNRVVVPQQQWKPMLQKIHQAHTGINGCLRRAPLLDFRNTPTESLAQIFFGQRTRMVGVPIAQRLLQLQFDTRWTMKSIFSSRETQKTYHDRKCLQLSVLQAGDKLLKHADKEDLFLQQPRWIEPIATTASPEIQTNGSNDDDDSMMMQGDQAKAQQVSVFALATPGDDEMIMIFMMIMI
ncbi:hypothetical protein CAPTEDRAFT_211265 [Capitella teleta]|uniref:Uncharacterized protein n=1 Tax=Capitella teleta TaxID=283909 RepID=R7TRB6_CAPTE|nr:hypothetical protein CAPTEDRAFT_211265 [Capitella teleta]|eukprot:ELT93575.1 hypothetical protein CAPTEDRAFT_211265 [Capitella teleta]